MHANNQREELSRQSLVRQAATINRKVHEHLRAASDAVSAGKARAAHVVIDGELGQVPLLTRMEYYAYLFGLCCVYWLDLMLFGATAQFLSALVGGDTDFVARIAKYAAPLAFIGIEVLLSLQIERAKETERFSFGAAALTKFWIGMGVLTALVMPAAAAATAQSAGVVAGSALPIFMVCVLGLVSFAAHVLILFGGGLAREAKTYLAFAVSRRFHDRRTKSTERRTKVSLAEANAMFITYVHAWRAHNAQYTALPSGPFDSTVIAFLKQQFPYLMTGDGADILPSERGEEVA